MENIYLSGNGERDIIDLSTNFSDDSDPNIAHGRSDNDQIFTDWIIDKGASNASFKSALMKP